MRVKNIVSRSRRFSILASPAGAGIAIICFFLPWVEVSCSAMTFRATGAQLGGMFWVVLALAVIILASFIVFRLIRQPSRFKQVSVVASALALTIMLYEFISAFARGGTDVNFGEIFTALRIGSWGEFLGFMLALAGPLLWDEKDLTAPKHPKEPEKVNA